ncbi:MAG: BREX-6 system BrxE protein, partial [Synechococcaceae cyanobacterium]|nr:BREX-6 system BrxE protein [Synechococcaceae cyanobacterium]
MGAGHRPLPPNRCGSPQAGQRISRIPESGHPSSLPPPVSLLELDPSAGGSGPEAPLTSPGQGAAVANSDLDIALTAQIVVAWAGESGEQPRLGWWQTDLVSEFGGEDLLKELLPRTWPWAMLQAVREAARRKDEELRAK